MIWGILRRPQAAGRGRERGGPAEALHAAASAWPGMRGHPEVVLITLPQRLEQPGSCRLSVQMGTKSVSSSFLGLQSAQCLDPGQHCNPQVHTPTCPLPTHGQPVPRCTIPGQPGAAGHLAWLTSAKKCHNPGTARSQIGLGLKADSTCLRALPQFHHL